MDATSQPIAASRGFNGLELMRSPRDDAVAMAFDTLESVENRDLPPSPCRARSNEHLDINQREEDLRLREKDLAERLQNLEFREFLLQEEKQQHQENVRLLAQRTGALEDRETRFLEQEKRRSTLSGSAASSAAGTPSPSSKKFRWQSPLGASPPRKQTPGTSEAISSVPSPPLRHTPSHSDDIAQSPECAVILETEIIENWPTHEADNHGMLQPEQEKDDKRDRDDNEPSSEQPVPEKIDEEKVDGINAAKQPDLEKVGEQKGDEPEPEKINEQEDDDINSGVKLGGSEEANDGSTVLASKSVPRLTRKPRRCQCARTFIGRIFCCALSLQIVIKTFVFVGILVSPQFHTAAVQNTALWLPESAALWLPESLQTFRNNFHPTSDPRTHSPNSTYLSASIESSAQQCQMALHSLRSELTDLHTQKSPLLKKDHDEFSSFKSDLVQQM